MKAPCVGMQGKMLPSVTVEDNGDVLTVVDGEWSKASGGGGGGSSAFIIQMTYSEDMTTATLDKTFNEIYTAVTDGSIAVIVSDLSELFSHTAIFMFIVSGVTNIGGTYNVTSIGTNNGNTNIIDFYVDTADDVLTAEL